MFLSSYAKNRIYSGLVISETQTMKSLLLCFGSKPI